VAKVGTSNPDHTISLKGCSEKLKKEYLGKKMLYDYKCISFQVFRACIEITNVCWIFTPISGLHLLRRFKVTYCLSLWITGLGQENAKFLRE
jgi:hypothetical protein